MHWWANDCQYYEFPSWLLANGAAEIRKRHVVRFQEPNLFGRLINRLSVANLVIDQETVTLTFPEGSGEVNVIAIYEVENGKIAKAWFRAETPSAAILAEGLPVERIARTRPRRFRPHLRLAQANQRSHSCGHNLRRQTVRWQRRNKNRTPHVSNYRISRKQPKRV